MFMAIYKNQSIIIKIELLITFIFLLNRYLETETRMADQSQLPQVIRTYYDTGELKEEYFEINGQKEGHYKRYYKNGILEKNCNYVNGKMNGEYKTYYPNGNLVSIWNYVNGRANGEYKRYNENGNIRYIVNYVDWFLQN